MTSATGCGDSSSPIDTRDGAIARATAMPLVRQMLRRAGGRHGGVVNSRDGGILEIMAMFDTLSLTGAVRIRIMWAGRPACLARSSLMAFGCTFIVKGRKGGGGGNRMCIAVSAQRSVSGRPGACSLLSQSR